MEWATYLLRIPQWEKILVSVPLRKLVQRCRFTGFPARSPTYVPEAILLQRYPPYHITIHPAHTFTCRLPHSLSPHLERAHHHVDISPRTVPIPP